MCLTPGYAVDINKDKKLFILLPLRCIVQLISHFQIPVTQLSNLDNNFFAGIRYILDGDKSTMLLFDSLGKIAGIQMGVSHYFR